MPTGYGSAIYEGHRPAADAACVALARAAGAIVLGKTVTTEFACFTAGQDRQSAQPGAYPGRLVERLGRGGRRRHGAARLRHADRRLDDPSRLVLRRRRLQAELWPDRRAPGSSRSPTASTRSATMARNVADAAFFAGVLGGRPALRDVAMPRRRRRISASTERRCGRRPSRAPSAALDHARAALERAGARVAEIAVPPEHRGLTAAQDTIMGFEMVRGLAYERLQHSAELSPRLAQLLDPA